MQPFFLNPNTGFNPSSSQQMNGQLGKSLGVPRPPFGGNPSDGTGRTINRQVGAPSSPQQPWSPSPQFGTAVRPTDQGGPQAAWMQNMATFAGGGVQGSSAFGNQPSGPVRRLVDVLGPQPFGEENPMTLLMKALQGSGYGLGRPTNNVGQPYSPNPTQPWWGL